MKLTMKKRKGEPVFTLPASDPFCVILLMTYRKLWADRYCEEYSDQVSDMMQEAVAWSKANGSQVLDEDCTPIEEDRIR